MDLQLQPSSSNQKIPMMTLDGVPFHVDVEVVMKMETLKPLIDKNDSGELINTIPLPNVTSHMLTKIIDYIKTHIKFKEKAKKCDNNEKINIHGCDKYGKFTMEAGAYDNKYLEDLDNDAIQKLLSAVNYLNVNDLLDFLNQGIANRIKNKSLEYVRNFFGIENDYTLEEEQAIRQEHAWAWDDIDDDDLFLNPQIFF